jgi:hypothetical protein
MRKTNWALAAVAAVATVGGSAAEAKTISFSGCTVAGVEHGCLMLRDGPRTYDITAAKPRPLVGRAIAGTGTRFTGPTTCQQGIRLANVRWHYTKMLCPIAKRTEG